jgi:hypothetical protein
MPADSLHLLLTMSAMVGGLLTFALLLLLGVRVVRWLQLPVDLPEGPRFEPPPPPTVAHGNRTQAVITAQAQAHLRTFYQLVHDAVRSAFETQEIHTQVNKGGDGAAFVRAAEVTARCAATAHSAGTLVEKTFEVIDQRLRSDRQQVTSQELATAKSVIDTHLVTIQGALNEARLAAQPLGDGGGNRRLLIMVGVLIVMVAWVVVMQTILKA